MPGSLSTNGGRVASQKSCVAIRAKAPRPPGGLMGEQPSDLAAGSGCTIQLFLVESKAQARSSLGPPALEQVGAELAGTGRVRLSEL